MVVDVARASIVPIVVAEVILAITVAIVIVVVIVGVVVVVVVAVVVVKPNCWTHSPEMLQNIVSFLSSC